MNYKVIDDNLHIATFRVEDLTLKYVQCILESFNDGSSIKTLTAFYDEKNDLILINADKSSKYLEYAKAYLTSDEEIREHTKLNCESEAKKEFIKVLDRSILNRKSAEIKKLVKYQYRTIPYSIKNADEMDALAYDNIDNKLVYGGDMYNLGYIHGKRAERARRKVKKDV